MADGDTWLEPGTVTSVLGSGVSEQLDDDQLAAVVPGVRDWIESERRDLIGIDEDDGTEKFLATPSVKLGASLLVYRIYQRPKAPFGLLGSSEDGYAGIVREDPDVARFLGIGAGRKFTFGAA